MTPSEFVPFAIIFKLNNENLLHQTLLTGCQARGGELVTRAESVCLLYQSRGGLKIQRITIWNHRCNYLLQILYQHMFSYLWKLGKELRFICLNKDCLSKLSKARASGDELRLYHLKFQKLFIPYSL
jgi:hypothetical protein